MGRCRDYAKILIFCVKKKADEEDGWVPLSLTVTDTVLVCLSSASLP